MRYTLLSAAIALGAAFAPVAQAQPRLVGGGENASVVYDFQDAGTFVGGGQVMATGGGDDRSVAYGPLQAPAGRDARLVGGGTDAEIVYGVTPRSRPGRSRRQPLPRLNEGSVGTRAGGQDQRPQPLLLRFPEGRDVFRRRPPGRGSLVEIGTSQRLGLERPPGQRVDPPDHRRW